MAKVGIDGHKSFFYYFKKLFLKINRFLILVVPVGWDCYYFNFATAKNSFINFEFFSWCKDEFDIEDSLPVISYSEYWKSGYNVN